MTVYLDIVFLLNYVIDFLIILTLGITLKYRIKIKRIVFSSLLGSLSLLILFVNLNNFSMLLFKLFISFILVVTAYGFKSISFTIKNIIYFFFISIIYGGFLYFIIDNFTFKSNGLTFIKTNTDLNIGLLVIISPIILYIYIKQIHSRYKVNLRTEVSVFIDRECIKLNGFIDTGNTLKEPYGGKDVMITNNIKIKNKIESNNYILIPCESVNGHSFIKGAKFEKVIINKKEFNNIVIAYTSVPIKIDGIDIILNGRMIENV